MVGGAESLFLDLGVILIVAAVASFGLRLIKQPNILSYVLVGILIGPVYTFFTNTNVVDPGVIESMSMIGIAFLLFIVGLEMDLKSLKNVTLVSTLGGGIQILIIFVLGYLAALSLGLLSLEAAYIGLILSFSSTMVVLKLLSDNRKLNTLHGRIAVGILLTQDIVAIFALSILTSINGFSASLLGIALVKFLIIFGFAYLTSKYIFPKIFGFAAKNQELLLITSLGVCFMFSLALHYFGFSIAIGAFIAGITLGNLEYNIEIIGKVKSLKDFFSLLFFVSLGMGLSLSVIKEMWLLFIVLLLIAIAIKPLVIMTICSLFKYTKKPSFLTANSLAQVGEFSLILAAQGLALNHISSDLFSLTVIVTLITITFSSYNIEHEDWFYKILKKPLRIFDLFTTEGLEYLPKKVEPKIILCGHNRIGYSILHKLKKQKDKLLIVDYNPEIITKMVKEGYHCIYGDAVDDEVLERMNLKKITMFISTIPGYNDNSFLIKKIRQVNRRAKIFCTSEDIETALKLYKRGADYVILPHFLGGEHASHLITKVRKKKLSLKEEKAMHVKHLEKRREVGHDHPKH